MRVVLGADHRGFELKDSLAALLRDQGHEVIDVGTNSAESVDYPDISLKLACTRSTTAGPNAPSSSAAPASAPASPPTSSRGIRAGITHDTYSAHQGVEHDDMNVICLGSACRRSARPGDRPRLSRRPLRSRRSATSAASKR